MPARRFPPPWSVEELAASFVVRDPQRPYVYFEDEAGRCLWHHAFHEPPNLFAEIERTPPDRD
jgi:hypothetical protein